MGLDNILDRVDFVSLMSRLLVKAIWTNPDKKQFFVEELKDQNVHIDLIKKIESLEESDSFDVIAHLAFNAPLLSRAERINIFMRENKERLDHLGVGVHKVILDIMDKYKYGGEENLSAEIFTLPAMHAKKEEVKKNYDGGIAGLFNMIKDKIYSVPKK